MNLKTPVNKNYCATVVRLEKFVDLDNCDNVKHAIIFGNSVIVAKTVQPYTYGLYFPVETKLSEQFISENNLSKKQELNKDPLEKGYFEESGRVKCVKFRGHKSEGFFIGISSLLPFVEAKELAKTFVVGTEFDEVNGIKICEKYVPKKSNTPGQGGKNKQSVKYISRLVDNQFRLHVDTENLRRNMEKLKPCDLVSITYKMHGTSFVVGKVLTKPKVGWFKTQLIKLGISEPKAPVYDVIYSSRRVVKNEYETKTNQHFYGYDLWAEIKDEVKDSLENGVTLYGKCVGFLKDGKAIQEGYDYGCKPGEHANYIYHITYTNNEGKVFHFSWGQVEEYCRKYGLNTVPKLYYGRLNKLAQLNEEEHWHENMLKKLETMYVKGDCYMCKNKVPLEGIAVVKDELFSHNPLKLKSFEFLERETKELDKGIIDLETQQTENEEV
jgi:hypothetical protein